MELQYREGEHGSFYVYYPDIEKHSPFRRYSLILLREDGEEASVKALMQDWNLKELAEKESLLIAFPNPPQGGWHVMEQEKLISYLCDVHSKMCEPKEYVFQTDELGIPTLACMLDRWHLMNDTRYYVGIGDGARAACTIALRKPKEIAALCCITDQAESGSEALEEELPVKELESIRMPVRYETRKSFPGMENIYEKFLGKYRRLNTGKHGDAAERMDFESAGFELYLRDTRLGDQNGMPHTWFVHVPSQTANGGAEEFPAKLPMVLFFHGGSDNPAEAAQMSRFHEIGEKEGFITVYPWGSDEASWNCNYVPTGKDDVAYIHALIGWMKEHYPVDEGRVYLSGFSNGAAMAQVYGMEYPEEIAGICHIDSNWPGHRLGLASIRASEVTAFQKAWKRKEEYDYRMPVWYTYGTGEPSYPVYRGCSQQLQYDFWKRYNHIAIEDTPKKENPHPSGCGVPGQSCELLMPSVEYPDHVYQVNRFYSEEGHLNLYNYVVMHDKGHEVAPMDPVLGWEYVKKFRREKDGSLTVLEHG